MTEVRRECLFQVVFWLPNSERHRVVFKVLVGFLRRFNKASVRPHIEANFRFRVSVLNQQRLKVDQAAQ
jgi:hypothetical protein